MREKRMIFTGEKESFIVRVLINKQQAAGVDCSFVPCSVNELHEQWDGDTLICLYIDDKTSANEEILHFLTDRMDEKGGQIVLIGEQIEIEYVREYVPEHHIYRIFSRPVDNVEFTAAINDYFRKSDAGDFKKSVLIVDDDPQYLSLVRQWLREDYKVAMANSGLQAIKLLGKNKVDLILLDHEMPITSGAQVLEMLRSDEETRKIPVFFLTGKSDKESVMKVVAFHPEGYLLKTIQKEELLEKLKEFFICHSN